MAIRDLRQTHTFAVLGLSRPAFDEIRTKLEAAGYQHAFVNDGATIDMQGIGVEAATPGVDPLRALLTTIRGVLINRGCHPAPWAYGCALCQLITDIDALIGPHATAGSDGRPDAGDDKVAR